MSVLKSFLMQKQQIMYATIKGSLTENDGVFSGFSASDYLDTTSPLDITQPFHIHIDIVSFTNIGASQYIFGFPSINCGVYFGVSATGLAFSHGSVYWTAISGVSTGVPFALDLKGDGTNLNFIIIQNGITKTASKSLVDLGFSESVTSFVRIGKLYQPFTSGSIDLNKSYIKLGSTKYKLQAVVGYKIVGNPTIVDGVVSEFSSSDYVTISQPSGTVNSFEINIKFTMPSSYTSGQSLLGYTTVYNGSSLLAYILLTSSNTIATYLFKKSDGTQTRYGVDYDISQHLSETFTFNVKTDMSNVYINLYNSNGQLVDTNTYTNQDLGGSITSSIKIGVRNNLSNAFSGSIDINNTFIKINNKLWFNGKPS